MGTSERITKYRDRLDRTLASPDLTNADTLKNLVKDHLQRSSLEENEVCTEILLERRTKEVSHFLDMLRSASVGSDGSKASQTSRAEWKLKQDNEEFRVMYREGPEGTPYHTLLVEGYVDGPMDTCLCLSWESALYKKWWPQYTMPAFKITSSKCLQKIRIGEQISSVRVKVSWPLSAREAIVHFFEFEYFQDDLIIVILNSISETEKIDKSTHGYTGDMIPEAKDVTRIGVIGGFALQKVTPERSYFRTIANVDLKLDFVPPSLINFIARQLIGSGFRLYQKAVASVFKSDEDFKQALNDPLYDRIRKAFYSMNQQNGGLEYNKLEDKAKVLIHEDIVDIAEDDIKDVNQDIPIDQSAGEFQPNDELPQYSSNYGEIEEVKSEEGIEGGNDLIINPSNGDVGEMSCLDRKKKVYIRPEVEEALGTLEKVISIVRQHGLNAHNCSPSQDLEINAVGVSISEKVGFISKDDIGAEELNRETIKKSTEEQRLSSGTHSLRDRKSNSSATREVSHSKVVPASPEERLLAPHQIDQVVASYSLESGKMEAPFSNSTTSDTKEMTIGPERADKNGIDAENSSRRWRRYRLCCFHPLHGH
ncbi:uncharacterized protein LOC115671385 [Syzygium oleosum]|uniref:uncharacterized protein LOC115671385 n=1 Tax=Syzygium oleosum TaxID=219896 RepID=UPI0011D1DD64|nr:uncharacterized protein LOC115671385 [Syzygium oleosum]XP_056158822.1 uncharacterized protein LOC115671385 [Syzygium oleosum]XP_056158823.1 uncharacterized protein LOC115671385 [Syzygium oleosum]XP_056158824.1 uncharacterized protein LOC115671385 [Syzygium oleosum]